MKTVRVHWMRRVKRVVEIGPLRFTPAPSMYDCPEYEQFENDVPADEVETFCMALIKRGDVLQWVDYNRGGFE